MFFFADSYICDWDLAKLGFLNEKLRIIYVN